MQCHVEVLKDGEPFPTAASTYVDALMGELVGVAADSGWLDLFKWDLDHEKPMVRHLSSASISPTGLTPKVLAALPSFAVVNNRENFTFGGEKNPKGTVLVVTPRFWW